VFLIFLLFQYSILGYFFVPEENKIFIEEIMLMPADTISLC